MCAVVMICSTLVNIQTDRWRSRQLIWTAQPAELKLRQSYCDETSVSGKLSRADNNTGWCHCWCIGYSSSVKMWFVCCFCCLSLCCLRNILCDIYVVLQVNVTCGSLVCRVTFWCQLTALKWWTVNRRRASSQSLATGQFDDILSQFSVVIASIVCLWYFIICYFCYFSIHSWQTAILSWLCRVYIYCCDRDALVATNHPAIAMMFIRLSVWDKHALWSYGAL